MINICKILHGSHLYGLNTHQSDTDYKGVFLPSLKDLILKTDSKHISKNSNNSDLRNTNKDIDFEMFSLHSFLDMVSTGQPMVLEMLFAPREMVIENSAYWEAIRSIRQNLLTSTTKAFVGYCKGQASKYCVKGDRLNTLDKCLDLFKSFNPLDNVTSYSNVLLSQMGGDKYFSSSISEDSHGDSFTILGKKFYFNAKVQTVVDSLKSTRKRYGNRSKITQEMGGKDWKALSHAVRIAIEIKELLTDGKITLPLKDKDREYVMRIKLGKINLIDVENELTLLLDDINSLQVKSTLPKELNKDVLWSLILGAYKVEFKDDNDYSISHWEY